MTRIETGIDYRETASSNPLARIIEQKIQESGPIPFDEYMSISLYGDIDSSGLYVPGFYTGKKIKIGDMESSKDADFPTVSEKTPLYGYIMGNQILEMWENLGFPSDFNVIEMGAGNGTMASDILNRFSEASDNQELPKDPKTEITYTIIENSKNLAIIQKNKLSVFGNRVNVILADSEQPPLKIDSGVVVSVELPDAFPVRKVRKNDEKIEECYVGPGDKENFSEVWLDPTEEVLFYINKYNPPLSDYPFPVSLKAERWMAQIASMIKQGYIITADYPHKIEGGKVPTLFMAESKGFGSDEDLHRGKDQHLRKEILGFVDMTTGVDFQMLSDVGKMNGLRSLGFVANSGFLFGMSADLILNKKVEERDLMIGDRMLNLGATDAVLASNGLNVLIQGKNIDSSKKLNGLNYRFNSDIVERGEVADECYEIDI